MLYSLIQAPSLSHPLILSFPHSYHGGRKAKSHHEDVMQHHEQLPAQVAPHSSTHRPVAVLLMPFDLQLVPVAQEHGVNIVGKVRCGKENIVVGQPVPEEQRQGEEGQVSHRREMLSFLLVLPG